MDDAHVVGAEPADVLLELGGSGLVRLDRDDLAGEHRRLAAGSGAEVEHALALLRADAETGELRADALRPDLAARERLGVEPLDAVGARDVRFGPVRGLAPDVPDDDRRRLVLRPHQRERIGLAEVAAPGLPDPVGIRVLERALGERVEEWADPVAERGGARRS